MGKNDYYEVLLVLLQHRHSWEGGEENRGPANPERFWESQSRTVVVPVASDGPFLARGAHES